MTFRAASNGFPPAQNNYALMLKRGLGIIMNDEETVEWYKKAAKQDYVISQNNLGYMYKTGKGVPANIEKAFYWFHRAAEIGYASAQKNVGDMFRTGHGVSRDYNMAEKYYLMAANQEHSVAMNSLGVLYQQSAADWIPNHRKAFEWYTRACKNSVAASEYNLYLMYLEKLVPGSDKMSDSESMARALAHLSRSVNHSNPSILGMLAYALRLLKGRGILRNKIEGVKWMMNVCMCGLTEALEELERLYLGQREFLFFGV
ncbi:MAG: sel1 repeat family protein, partial [Cytophagales bacterium]|nr:sel1 repeat family protein [Cytophagales bacterium]